MSARVAVLLVHGMGSQGPGFGTGFAATVERRVAEATGRTDAVVVAGAHWAPVLQDAEADLLRRTTSAARLGWSPLRAFAVHFLADAAAYAETPRDRTVYDRVHGVLAAALRDLARAAGPTAPLVVVAHSLGTWIASNALYDLGELPDRDLRGALARAASGGTPLECGETLARFYTLGSPLALFALRYPDYGLPIQVPSPRLAAHHPDLGGGWWNVFDPDDVLAWPLRPLSARYADAVTADVAQQVGSFLGGWTPLAHVGYWDDAGVQRLVAEGVVETWRRARAS